MIRKLINFLPQYRNNSPNKDKTRMALSKNQYNNNFKPLNSQRMSYLVILVSTLISIICMKYGPTNASPSPNDLDQLQKQNYFGGQVVYGFPSGAYPVQGQRASWINVNNNHLVRSPGLYETKRTRKTSAFMPMRGKKDAKSDSDNFYMVKELDSDPTNTRLTGLKPTDGSFRDGNGKLWMPRQFAEQMASYQRSAEVPIIVPSAPSDMLAAKLRRAFHPMRGKKADPRMELLAMDMSESGSEDFDTDDSLSTTSS